MKPNNEGTDLTTHRILRLVLDDLGLGCKYVGRTRKILSALGRASNLEVLGRDRAVLFDLRTKTGGLLRIQHIKNRAKNTGRRILYRLVE
jgi:hypothetical protein